MRPVYENELYHHGIKGQKWGVRRYQNEDGSYTSEGQKRRESKNVKRRRIERNIAIGAAAVLASGVLAYGASRYLKENKDLVISGKETLQRITMRSESDKLYDNFYAAVGKHDKTRYKAFITKLHFDKKESGPHLLKEIGINNDKMKIASPGSAKKVFNKLKAKDPAFRSAFIGSNYSDFNTAIPNYRHNENTYKQYSKFVKEMSKKGYSGVIDVNDRSGYQAKHPIIVFNAADAFVKNVENISSNNKLFKSEFRKYSIEAVMDSPKIVATLMAPVSFVTAVNAINANDRYKEELTNESRSAKSDS